MNMAAREGDPHQRAWAKMATDAMVMFIGCVMLCMTCILIMLYYIVLCYDVLHYVMLCVVYVCMYVCMYVGR